MFIFFRKNFSKENLQPFIKIEETVNQTNEPVKTISFKVKGVSIGDRPKLLKQFVKSIKKSERFDSDGLWGGETNKDIKDLDLKVFEFDACLLPLARLELENANPHDLNEIKVILRDFEENEYFIGYVPKELNIKLRSLMKEYYTLATPMMIGGRYKKYDYDQEKVKIVDGLDYGIEINLSFWEERPFSLA